MITKNFKALLAVLLLAKDSPYFGILPVKNRSGSTKYLTSYFKNTNSFPYSLTASVGFSDTGYGLCVGSGNTAATEDDYTLEQAITSGLSASSPSATPSLDSSGNPQLEIVFTLTNTTSSDIVVKEIGYVQKLYVASQQGGSSATTENCLLDRTVLETPVTIPANGYAAMKYTLKTIMPS